jgi:hypothetical protein
VLPLLDPDGAVKNLYETKVIHGFEADYAIHETLIWGQWLRDWVNAGNRLDLTFNLHNVESNEGPQVFPYMFEGGPRKGMCDAVHADVRRQLSGFSVAPGCSRCGTFSSRLGGWLRTYFGTHMMFYEVNSQAPDRHLSLYELKAVGVGMLRGGAVHLNSRQSAPLVQAISRMQQARRMRLERYSVLPYLNSGEWNLFELEDLYLSRPYAESVYLRPEVRVPVWFMPVFETHGWGGPPKRLFHTGDEGGLIW